MNKWIKFTALLGFVASSAYADVYYSLNRSVNIYGMNFTKCEACSTDQDFINQAELRYEELNKPPTASIATRLANQFVVLNSESNVFRTVKVSTGTELEDFGQSSNPFGQPANPLFGPASEFGTLQGSSVVPNSANTIRLFREYRRDKKRFSTIDYGELEEYRRSIAGIDNVVDLGKLDIQWAGTSNFADAARTFVAEALAQTEYNPFHFVDSPLSVSFKTIDGVSVHLVSKYPTAKPKWFVNYVRQVRYKDADGNLIPIATSYNELMQCFANKTGLEICREIQYGIPQGPILVRDPFQLNDQGKPPTGCNPSQEDCDPIGVFIGPGGLL